MRKNFGKEGKFWKRGKKEIRRILTLIVLIANITNVLVTFPSSFYAEKIQVEITPDEGEFQGLLLVNPQICIYYFWHFVRLAFVLEYLELPPLLLANVCVAQQFDLLSNSV